jgi:hypothetical protein
MTSVERRVTAAAHYPLDLAAGAPRRRRCRVQAISTAQEVTILCSLTNEVPAGRLAPKTRLTAERRCLVAAKPRH